MSALTTVEQAELLATLAEGDVLECGQLFTFAPGERLVWRCEEVATVEGRQRYTFHVYYMGVLLRSAVAYRNKAGEVQWGVKP